MAFLYPWGNTQQLNLDWILQKIKDLEAGSGATLAEVANALISAAYSSSQAYDRSDIVYHDGKLYRANQAIPAPGEAWTPAHWDEILLGDTVSNLVQYVAALSNDQIVNNSVVAGTHTSNALNTLNSAITPNVIPNTDDLDNYRGASYNGVYSINQAPINSPLSWAKLTVIADDTSTTQFITSGAGIYFRQYAGSPLHWSDWQYYNESMSTTIKDAKMRSVTNSILTGAIWKNGSYDSMTDYNNSPYCIIGKMLGLRTENIVHTMLSGAGLIHESDGNSFYKYIVTNQLNLTGYDYLMTMLWTEDMSYQIGTVNDTSNNNTICGKIVGVIDYLKTNYPKTRLIVVGIPPVSYTIAGNNVFSGLYSNGASISDCNRIVRELSIKHHFIFVDWEDYFISYYYQNFTDGNNVHPNNADVYRSMGEYVALEVVGERNRPEKEETNKTPSKVLYDSSSTTSRYITLPNNARVVLTIMDSSSPVCGMYFVITFASGVVGTKAISASTGVTLTTSTNNRLIITTDDSRQLTYELKALSGYIDSYQLVI